MSLKEVQKQTDLFTSQFTPQYWHPLEIITRLTEETGELAREVNHRWGPKKKKSTEDKAAIEEEMADIIFTVCCLANSQNVNLDDAWNKKFNLLLKRDKDRFEKA